MGCMQDQPKKDNKPKNNNKTAPKNNVNRESVDQLPVTMNRLESNNMYKKYIRSDPLITF